MTSSRLSRDRPVSEHPGLLRAALNVFAEHGYHGASVRDIATSAGLSVPGLYHHYKSKQQILIDLMLGIMHELLEQAQDELAAAPIDPLARVDALVECLLRFHMVKRDEAFVASSEIRSLEPANRRRYIKLRDEVQRMLETEIAEARDLGLLGVDDPRDAARAVSTLCVGVASWYRPDGPLSADSVIDRQLTLIHGLLRVPPR